MTKIQKYMLNLIMNANRHLTAEQIYDLVKKEYPSVSMSTVYRNLSIFSENREIRRIERAIGSDFYECNLSPHDHAYCVKCGNIMDVKISSLKDFLKENFNYPIISFDLLINYICPDCEKNT